MSINPHLRGLGLIKSLLHYLLTSKGIMSTGSHDVVAFLKSDPTLDRPDIELIMGPMSTRPGKLNMDVEKEHGIMVIGYQLRPKSRGEVMIRSANPIVPPIIRPNALTHAEDRAYGAKIIEAIRRICATAPLSELIAHETFPGHHAEHAWKERRLIEELGWQEEGIQLVPTPQAVVSEGIAEVGPGLVLDDATLEAITAVVHGHGVAYDPASAEEIAEARRGIRSVGINVALAIHEQGMERAEAEAYLERWSLVTPSRAKQSVDFLTDPVWRAYSITYSEGRRLVEALVGTDTKAFGRLLTEQIRIGELVAAAA